MTFRRRTEWFWAPQRVTATWQRKWSEWLIPLAGCGLTARWKESQQVFLLLQPQPRWAGDDAADDDGSSVAPGDDYCRGTVLNTRHDSHLCPWRHALRSNDYCRTWRRTAANAWGSGNCPGTGVPRSRGDQKTSRLGNFRQKNSQYSIPNLLYFPERGTKVAKSLV